MPNKTLYVRDDDTPIWEAAAMAAGEGNLSTYVTEALRTRLATPAVTDDVERIEVELRSETAFGEVKERKAFYGRWLVHPEEGISEDEEWGVAITRKGQFVYFSQQNYEFRVVPTLEELRPFLDQDAYDVALSGLDVVEELDI